MKILVLTVEELFIAEEERTCSYKNSNISFNNCGLIIRGWQFSPIYIGKNLYAMSEDENDITIADYEGIRNGPSIDKTH